MNRRGASLIEILIVACVLCVLFGGIALVLAQSGQNVWVYTQTQLTGLTQAQHALDRLSEDLRSGARYTTGMGPTSPACLTVGSTTCTSPPCLEFEPVGGGARITYQCPNCSAETPGDLVKMQGEVPQIVASGLVAFEPVCQGATVELTVKVPTLHHDLKTFKSRVWVRNP